MASARVRYVAGRYIESGTLVVPFALARPLGYGGFATGDMLIVGDTMMPRVLYVPDPAAITWSDLQLIPLGFPYWYRTPPPALTRGHTDVIALGMAATPSPFAIDALLAARDLPPITRSGFLADVVETVERAAATARNGEPLDSAIDAAAAELVALFHAVLTGVYVGRWDW